LINIDRRNGGRCFLTEIEEDKFLRELIKQRFASV